MSRRRIALGVGANVLDRIVVSLMQLALVPVLASHWGLATYGGWAMLTTVPGLFALGDLGFANAATVRMTMEVARGELAAARQTVRSATQVVVAACGIVMLLVGGAALLLPGWAILDVPQTSSTDMRWAILMLAAYAVLIMNTALVQGVFRSTERFAMGAVLATITALLENSLLIAVVLTGHGIVAGAAALMLGRLAGFTIMLASAALLRTGLLPALRGGNATVRRELLRPALAAMSIPLASALLLQGTVAALGFAAGALAVPAFVAARTLSRIGLQSTQMLATALMPEFGAATAKGNLRGVLRMFVLVLGTAVAIALPFAILLALAGPWLVMLWSNGHIHASKKLMVTIAVSSFCGCIWNPLSNLMLAINRQADFAIAYAGLAVFGLLLTLKLGSTLGSTAPALALAVVDAIMTVVIIRFSIKKWEGFGEWRRTFFEMATELTSDVTNLINEFRRR